MDEAALAGTALAAVVALFLSEGAWTWLELPVGAALLAVLTAFYDLPHDLPWRRRSLLSDGRWRKRVEVAAVAVVAALCLLLVVAWPFQSAMHAAGLLRECDDIYAARLTYDMGEQAWAAGQVHQVGGPLAMKGAQDALSEDDAADVRGKCWGDKTYPWLGVITAASFLAAFGILAWRSTSPLPRRAESIRPASDPAGASAKPDPTT